VAERLAACINDPRDPASTVHTIADIIRFRLLMIAAGYEDGNDATSSLSDSGRFRPKCAMFGILRGIYSNNNPNNGSCLNNYFNFCLSPTGC
jgi:hypothetical protein